MSKPWIVRCPKKCEVCTGSRLERNWCRDEEGHPGDHRCYAHVGAAVVAIEGNQPT